MGDIVDLDAEEGSDDRRLGDRLTNLQVVDEQSVDSVAVVRELRKPD